MITDEWKRVLTAMLLVIGLLAILGTGAAFIADAAQTPEATQPEDTSSTTSAVSGAPRDYRHRTLVLTLVTEQGVAVSTIATRYPDYESCKEGGETWKLLADAQLLYHAHSTAAWSCL